MESFIRSARAANVAPRLRHRNRAVSQVAVSVEIV